MYGSSSIGGLDLVATNRAVFILTRKDGIRTRESAVIGFYLLPLKPLSERWVLGFLVTEFQRTLDIRIHNLATTVQNPNPTRQNPYKASQNPDKISQNQNTSSQILNVLSQNFLLGIFM